MDQKSEEKNEGAVSHSDFDCPICFFIVTEPVKLNCVHVICLNCLEKILVSMSRKCPLCRKEKTYELHGDPFLERLEGIYTERLSKKGLLEIAISYGNEHVFVSNSGYNNHKWKAFVRVEKSNNYLKSFMDKFKLNAYTKLYFEFMKSEGNNEKLKNVIELMQKKDSKQEEFSNIDLEKLDIIKRVVFHLHPTFTPQHVILEDKPFEIERLGWGTFNIPITVEFKDSFKLSPLELEFNLCFTRPIHKKLEPIWIEATLE